MTAAAVEATVSRRCTSGRHGRCPGILPGAICGCDCGHLSSRNVRAAAAVALNARAVWPDDPSIFHDDARELLAMIGVIDGLHGRQILPDDLRQNRPVKLGAGALNTDGPPLHLVDDEDDDLDQDDVVDLVHAPRSKRVTTPAGLAVLPPPAAQPKPTPKPAPKPAAERPKRPRSAPKQAPRRVEAAAEPAQKKRRAVAVCGTTAGHSAHKRKKEPPCQPCKDASAAYQREYLLRRGHKPRTPAACGTRAGYQRHSRVGEAPCEPCREASAVHARETYRRKHAVTGSKARVAECGTRSGYLRHLRLQEPVCVPCRESENEYHRARRAAAKPKPTLLPAKRIAPVLPPIPHGTAEGWQTHHDRGALPVCEACEAAVAPPPPKPVSAAELLADAQRSPDRAVTRAAAAGIRLLVQISTAPPSRVDRLLTELADVLADVSRAQARASSRSNGDT